MKTIYLVRHGETEHNSAGLIQGPDATLSALGRKQASQVAKRVGHLSFEHFLASDYERARETAQCIEAHIQRSPQYTALVRETKRPTSLINVSNQSEAFLEFLQAEEAALDDPNWHFADEENFFDVRARVETLFAELSQKSGNTLIVTHGRFIIYVVAYVLARQNLTVDFWRTCRYCFETSNTGITTLIFNERYQNWRLQTFNDQAHFADI